MSLHAIVQDGLATRLRLRRNGTARSTSRTGAVPLRISISSMRILETSIALGAVVAALLIGAGR